MSLEHGDNGFVGRFWANREAVAEKKPAEAPKEAKMSCAGGDALREEARRERAEEEAKNRRLLALADAVACAKECVATAKLNAETAQRAQARLVELEIERQELENLLAKADETTAVAAQRLETIRRYGEEVLGGGLAFISDCARAALDLGQYKTGIERIRIERARERERRAAKGEEPLP